MESYQSQVTLGTSQKERCSVSGSSEDSYILQRMLMKMWCSVVECLDEILCLLQSATKMRMFKIIWTRIDFILSQNIILILQFNKLIMKI